MSMEQSSRVSSSEEYRPNFELAGSLQGILSSLDKRDFTLDIQQDEALKAIGHSLVEGVPSGYIEMATSTGKTAVEALIAEAAVRSGRRVLILAPKINIANQIIGNNPDKPTGISRFTSLPDGTTVKSHFGAQSADNQADIVVSTYAGFLNDYKNNHAQLGEFDVIVADECHRSLGKETSNALKNAFPDAFKLGLSATPDFAADRKSDEVYDRLLYEFSLMDAIESGKTAPVRALVYETHEKIVTSQSFGDFTERELAPLIENIERNGTALELAKSFVAEGRQGIISCIAGDGNIHARKMAQILQKNGITSLDIGSHLPADEQAVRLKRFQNGEIDVLTFTRALEEGWDSDKASFAINMAPTTSPVRTKQLIGRLLRKKPAGIESIYIDFIDETRGNVKNQYTALHALELENIDLSRVLGQPHANTEAYNRDDRELSGLSPKLLELLGKSHGKRIADILAASKIDPELHKWERILHEEFKKDNESADLSPHIVFDSEFAKKCEKAYQKFITENGVEPTSDELIEALGKIPQYKQKLLAEYAFRLPLDDVMNESVEQPDEMAEADMAEVLDMINFKKVRMAMVNHLDSREYGILMLASGMIQEQQLKPGYDLAGLVYDVTAQRARQIGQEAAEKVQAAIGIEKPFKERSLGEHLNLYCDFDALNPTTLEQANTAYAILALENFAKIKDEGGLGYVRTNSEILNAFHTKSITVLPSNYGPVVNLIASDVILPVAQKLYDDAKRLGYKKEIAVLEDAVGMLEWLATGYKANQTLKFSNRQIKLVARLPFAPEATTPNVGFIAK